MNETDEQVGVPQSFDAVVWADEWCRIAREIVAANDSRQVIDEAWMVGWFANALMRGYDEGRRQDSPLIAAAPELLQALKGIVGCFLREGSGLLEKIEACRAAIAKAEGR